MSKTKAVKAGGSGSPPAETICGGHWLENEALASDVVLKAISGLAVAPDGSVYVSAQEINRILKYQPDGKIVYVAGSGAPGFSGDGGLAEDAEVSFPFGLALSAAGELYVADMGNRRVRRIDAKGNIETVIGGGATVALDKIPAQGIAAKQIPLQFPFGLLIDANGLVWVSDAEAGQVYVYDPATQLARVAMAKARGGAVDPTGMAIVAGHLFVADRGMSRILRMNISSGKIEEWFGGVSDERSNRFMTPTGLLPDEAGGLLVSDTAREKIFRIDLSSRKVTEFAGDGQSRHAGDGGSARKCSFRLPATLARGKDGRIYVAERFNYCVRSIEPSGQVRTLAGRSVGDGGDAKQAWLRNPRGIAFDASGNCYVSDCNHWRVRKIDKVTGKIETVVGSGYYTHGEHGGGPLKVAVYSPQGLVFDAKGLLYIADANYYGVWRVDFQKRTAEFAVQDKRLLGACALAFGKSGELYIATHGGQAVWQLDPNGALSVFAGVPGTRGFSGDGGKATAALLDGPAGLAVGPDGEVYIVERGNNRVRVVRDGKIKTYAGSGAYGEPTDGELAVKANLNSPGILVDEAGDLLLVDIHLLVWRVEGSTGKIRFVAGKNMSQIGVPSSVVGAAALHNGAVYVADEGKQAISVIKGI